MEKKSEVVGFDPWQKLAHNGGIKDVPLDEVLKKLEVTSKEAPIVKRLMLSQVKKITKAQG